MLKQKLEKQLNVPERGKNIKYDLRITFKEHFKMQDSFGN